MAAEPSLDRWLIAKEASRTGKEFIEQEQQSPGFQGYAIDTETCCISRLLNMKWGMGG